MERDEGGSPGADRQWVAEVDRAMDLLRSKLGDADPAFLVASLGLKIRDAIKAHEPEMAEAHFQLLRDTAAHARFLFLGALLEVKTELYEVPKMTAIGLQAAQDPAARSMGVWLERVLAGDWWLVPKPCKTGCGQHVFGRAQYCKKCVQSRADAKRGRAKSTRSAASNTQKSSDAQRKAMAEVP